MHIAHNPLIRGTSLTAVSRRRRTVAGD